MGCGLDQHLHVAPFTGGTAAPAALLVVITGQRQARHGANTGQCFTAKAQAADPLQIFQGGNFTGGVAGQGQGQILRRHTATVIANAYQLAAAGLHIDIHPGGTRVQAVLQHFLHHGSGALYHFASGNLVGQS